MKITIVVDNKKSWFVPYAREIVKRLKKEHRVRLLFDYNKLTRGECAFFLSCLKIIPKGLLSLNRNNLVIHGSDLPKGRGFSPIPWQILEGRNRIVLTLFEADEKLDSGDIYFKEIVNFRGHELLNEIHHKIGEKIVSMVLRFVSEYPNIKRRKQIGRPTYYPRRTIKDDELPINKTITQLFNRFRVADSEKYPAYFYYKGHKYILKIYKNKDKLD